VIGIGILTVLTPLFQTSFLPDLMQVNFTFLTIEVAPALAQVAPDFATTLTPLFQTSFLPDLMQVNFTFLTIEVAPALAQVVPDVAPDFASAAPA
jgi:inorganic triphosphatase YgiF